MTESLIKEYFAWRNFEDTSVKLKVGEFVFVNKSLCIDTAGCCRYDDVGHLK